MHESETEPTSGDAAREEFLAKSQEKRPSLAAEVLQFVSETRKWWLLPLILALAILGALAAFGTSTAGPFVYTFF